MGKASGRKQERGALDRVRLGAMLSQALSVIRQATDPERALRTATVAIQDIQKAFGLSQGIPQFSLTPNTPWKPLARGTVIRGLDLYDPALDGEVFLNDQYVVFRRQIGPDSVHLSIRRQDREPANDWRDFQRIKSELAGPEWEAVQLYPAESRLVDTSNQYHLWCIRGRFPFGWDERCVMSEDGRIQGARQRPVPDDWEVTTAEDLARQIEGVKAMRQAAREEGIDLR